MKRRQFLQTSTVLLAAQALGPRVTRRAEQKTAPGVAGRAGRPRLYFNGDAVARLRRRIEVEAGVKQCWSKLLARAETLVRAELVTEAAARQPARKGSRARANYPQSSGQLSDMGIRQRCHAMVSAPPGARVGASLVAAASVGRPGFGRGAALYCGAKPARLKVNGNPTSCEHSLRDKLVRFQMSDSPKPGQ